MHCVIPVHLSLGNPAVDGRVIGVHHYDLMDDSEIRWSTRRMDKIYSLSRKTPGLGTVEHNHGTSGYWLWRRRERTR